VAHAKSGQKPAIGVGHRRSAPQNSSLPRTCERAEGKAKASAGPIRASPVPRAEGHQHLFRRLPFPPKTKRITLSKGNTKNMETTLIILKPDAVQRGLMGKIISRFEDKGLHIVGMKMMQIPMSLAEKHYESHKGKPFYPGLTRFMTSSPV